MPESQLRQRIRTALRRAFPGALVLGWPANMWTGGGWPDLLVSEWPLLVGLEVKQGRRSKPTLLQFARHALLREHRIPVFVVHTPDEAINRIRTLKEEIPMAFDPALLAELDAALSETAPEPSIQAQADADQNTYDLANGTATLEDLPVFEEVKLDPDKPAPDIQDLTDAIVANAEISVMETEALIEIANAQDNLLAGLKASLDALTVAINRLRIDINADMEEDDLRPVPQTAEAPAPRRRTKRS